MIEQHAQGGKMLFGGRGGSVLGELFDVGGYQHGCDLF